MSRIALVTSSYLPRVGGVEEHVRQVAPELARRGHDVVVWAVDQHDEVTDEVDGIPVRYLSCPMPARDIATLGGFVRDFPGAWAAWDRAFRRDTPDILHVHCYGPNGTYATALAAAHGVPLVYSHHGETFGDAHRVFDTSALMQRSIRWTLSRADAVTSCSAFAARDLERFGLSVDRIAVVPNGVDLHVPVGAVPTGLPGRFIAGVGRLVTVKGFDLLIRAFAQVAPRIPGVDLVIGGDGPERTTLTVQAERLGIAERVHLPGMLDRGEVAAVMARAEIVVVPSRMEAFGITVLEAWRAGTPVIATNVGGPGTFVSDGVTGLLVDPENQDELAAAIVGLLEDPRLRDQCARGGRAAVQHFTWSAATEAYTRLYATIMRTRARGAAR